MDLFFEIMEGELRGDRTPIREGLTIGRQGCDLNIRDSKVSSKHAQVERRPDGALWLVDLGSSNQIKTELGKTTELLLEPGVIFNIGRVQMRVIAPLAQMFMDSTQPEILIQTPTNTWRDAVLNLLKSAATDAHTETREIAPLASLLRMKIQRGLQAGTEWTIGYGPRAVGAASMDLPLFEPGLPETCFHLYPKGASVILKVTKIAKGRVLVNGVEIENALLENGDEIDIGETRIKIAFDA